MFSLFVMAIIVTSLATYISRILGVITSEKISEGSKPIVYPLQLYPLIANAKLNDSEPSK